MKHVVESQQFDKKLIGQIFGMADKLGKKSGTPLKGKVMAALFYEPSTRTRFSFESAMLRLGGSVITTENAKEFSSAAKGETLEDSIRVVSSYVDVIVLRHYEQGASKRASLVSRVPIVNAGDGIGQHPTQALLDLYTIQKEVGKINGVSIAFIGDLEHSRTIHSLCYLLGKYKDITIYFVSPKILRIGDDIKGYLKKHDVTYFETTDLKSVVPKVDVVYQTRIQKERFNNKKAFQTLEKEYFIDKKILGLMKAKSIIMHPLPRVHEILPEVDASPKAVYFKQPYYGLLIRMALLKYLLGK